MNQWGGFSREAVWDTAVLTGCLGFLAWLIPWSLVFSETLPTGGDTPSQYAAMVHFIEHVLPKFRLWGWDPGSLAGYPQGQFYFPLPFLGLALLDLFLHPTVAFKLGVLLPALSLPLAVWYCLKRTGLAFPGPALGAALSLSFLLFETNKVWGGNLASILAGEFCYAWAMNLVLVYLGLLPLWIRQGRGLIRCSVFLFLIGLSHAYGLLFALTAGLFFLVRPMGQGLWSACLRLLCVYGIAFFLLCLWVIPMLAYSPYTEMFNFVWVIDSWRNFLPPTLWPVLALALAGAVLAWKPGNGQDRERAWYLLFWIAASATLYLVAPFMNAVTIRFGPFGHLATVLLGAQGLVLLTGKLRAKGLVALAILLAGMTWAGARVTYLDHWLNWNNAGVERQPLWPALERLGDHLQGDPSWPRVHYEHSPLNGQAGSVRVFESLPLLTGRSTLEGVYLQASATAPFIFYLQSETSQRGSSPLPGYVYSRLDLDRALVHMRLFNVSHFICVEPKTIALARNHPGLFLEREFPPFAVFRVLENSGYYAQVPRYRPILVQTDRPQAVAYQWFRFTDCQVPLVYAKEVPQGSEKPFAEIIRDSGEPDDPLFKRIAAGDLPRKPLDRVRLREKFDRERIEVRGLIKGKPILIRVSYHPAWKSRNGERIFRAGPAFMMVWPESDELVLTFGYDWAHWLGLGLSVLGVLIIVLVLLRPGLLDHPWLQPADRPRSRAAPYLTALAVLLWGLGLGALLADHDDATTIRNKARTLTEQGRLAEAREVFKEGLGRFPMSLVVDYTIYDLALTHVQAGEYDQAEKYLWRIIREFSDSILLPETLYHYGLCLKRTNREEEAFEYWQRLIMDFPETHWAGLARQGQ